MRNSDGDTESSARVKHRRAPDGTEDFHSALQRNGARGSHGGNPDREETTSHSRRLWTKPETGRMITRGRGKENKSTKRSWLKKSLVDDADRGQYENLTGRPKKEFG